MSGIAGKAAIDGMVTFSLEANEEIEVARNVEHVLVTSGTGVPTSGLILGR